ncbi:alcohol oxidase [Trametopsis cervina]|nr:alcohol oxidase [Trametopsis cervina]
MAAKIEEVANQSFDYIILGGGTAGLTLAAGLSEDGTKSVLVLEAGAAHIDSPDIARPAHYGSHLANPDYAYAYKLATQKFAGNSDRVVLGGGKLLGGSSGINFLCWLKPSRGDLDDFEALGNPGWNWKNYHKYITQLEGFTPPAKDAVQKVQLKMHELGTKGPLAIQFPHKIDEFEHHVQQTLANNGFHPAAHPMSGDPNGYFYSLVTHNTKWKRSYAVPAFYLPNKDRKNLTVLVTATVHRVLSKTSSEGAFVATGVEFEYGGQVHTVHANKEVILSSGTINSPRILELSGIGSKGVLEKAGIPLKVDLPSVGENLQEHVLVGLSFEVKEEVHYDTQEILSDPVVFAEHVKLHESGQGIFTTGVTNFGFYTLDQISPRAAELYKRMQDIVAKLDPTTARPGLLEQYNILLNRYKPGSKNPGLEIINYPGLMSGPKVPEPGKRYTSLVVVLNHVWSRGNIHITSSDPKDSSHIDPHYFEQEIDLELLLDLVKRARSISQTAPLKDLIVKEHNPGPEIQGDEDIKKWILQTFGTVWHTASSCSLLPKDKGGVVDSDLKVYGTSNLRVVDLSVVPIHVGTHTQSTVYGIAGQAAAIINGTHTA